MYWHKYAGNWDSANIPITYLLQKKLLRKLVTDKRKVTVNTVDAKISADIIPFDNPCITEAEMQSAKNVSKLFAGKMTLLFVGNLVNAKGILPLLDAMNIIDISKVEQLIIAGDGPLREMVEGLAATLPVRVQLTGVLSREELNGCYRQSHFLLLPSKTEGFPKVIAEAAAYGCIPVSTAVGSIPRYIKHKQNGWLLEDDMPATIASALTELLASDSAYLQSLSENASALTETFTYERYVSRLKNEIFSFS
jgi:glycosyltransferase involved in cell wall biosynthesis